jgi:hypothetical protein
LKFPAGLHWYSDFARSLQAITVIQFVVDHRILGWEYAEHALTPKFGIQYQGIGENLMKVTKKV